MKLSYQLAFGIAVTMVVGFTWFYTTHRSDPSPRTSPALSQPKAFEVATALSKEDTVPPTSKAEPEPSSETAALLEQLAVLAALPESAARNQLTLDLLCQLAVLQGVLAIDALFKLDDESFRRQAFGSILSAWADGDALAALQWFHDPARDSLATTDYVAPPDFHEKCFRQLALRDTASAAVSLPAVSEPANRLRAVAAMIGIAKERSNLPAMLDALGSKAELHPVEMALLNKMVGDEIGYGEWSAQVSDPVESKLLEQELSGLSLTMPN